MKLEYGRDSFEALNDAHAGETVFVVGAGPQLGLLSRPERRLLERQTTIGVNKTCYAVQPTYFLSAYAHDVFLAAHRCPEITVIHARPVYEPPVVPGTFPLKRAIFDAAVGLTDRLRPPEPTLYTKLNVAFAATHLALVVGARRIVYVGVEQRNLVHFYHYDEQAREAIARDLPLLEGATFLNVDHPYPSYEQQVAKLATPIDEARRRPFFEESHEDTFRAYFSELRSRGVEVYATTPDSAAADAGAAVARLDDFLGS